MKPLEVIPAIDLRGGYAVRLLQGDYAQETRYHDDPVALAQHWAQRVARRFANRLFVGRLPLGDPFGFHHQRLVRREAHNRK